MPKNVIRPIHPGEILREEFLLPLGMSAHALAQALRVPITRINDYVSEKRAGTADIALGLARYFQTTLEFWRNVQPLTCAAPRRNLMRTVISGITCVRTSEMDSLKLVKIHQVSATDHAQAPPGTICGDCKKGSRQAVARPMTTAAREVLEDCRGAVDELADGVQGRQWRRRWIVAVVLLRAVGHVLDNVDGKRDPSIRAAIDAWWVNLKSTKPEPRIFWGFIDEERNTIVKQYQMRAGQGVTVRLGGIEINLQTGEEKIDPPVPPIYHYTINSGPYAGRDQRELLLEAIEWWENQLGVIDDATAKL